MTRNPLAIAAAWFVLLTWAGGASAAELAVGMASADITPTGPAALAGQFHLRISKSVETPVTANVLVLESRDGDRSLDTAVMISCDLISAPDDLAESIRTEIHQRVPDLDVMKVVVNGTHTHTAPVPSESKNTYTIPTEGVVQPSQYQAFVAGRVAEAVEKAWSGRAPGTFTWGLGHAVVAQNRRAVYADGSAVMYGKTNNQSFRAIEGYEDHDVGTLFFWNQAGKLLGAVVDVSCPAQEVEGREAINADYWHGVRERLRERLGQEIVVVAWCGAAGDQSPHLMVCRASDDRMTKLRGHSRLEEIARRVDRAVEESYEAVKDDRHDGATLVHKVETLQLPMRLVTDAEYAEATAACAELAKQLAEKPNSDAVRRRIAWHQRVIDRFDAQKTEPNPTCDAEIHVIRLGDVVICSNPFELFTDYGVQIKARSPAAQTFIIQLAGRGTYLPSERAVAGGGYSAVPQSSRVGPKGGQVLVERTVELIESTWK